jgi:hypothetical protein
MDSIYVLLFTLLLYIFFGTLVDVFVATNSSTQLLRIKTKVIFHTFVAPIIFGLVIFFVILTDNKAFNIFFGIGLIIGSLIRAFFGARNYLTYFHLTNSQLEIKYLTSLLKAKRLSFDLTDVTNIEAEKANWLIDYPAAINIKSKSGWTKFYLIDKKLKSVVQSDIDAANSGIANSGAGQLNNQQ